MKPAPRKSSTDIPFNLLNRKELAIQLSTRTQHVLAPSLLDLLIFIFVRFRHLGRELGLSLVSPSFLELLFRLLVFMTSLNRLLELAACREFSCRFCGLFAHHEHREADGWRRNFEVIGGRLNRTHPCHQHQYPRVAHQRFKRAMASRALRPHLLLDLSVPRASQRLWKKQPVRGIHSQPVDSAFASQIDAVDVLVESSGWERNSDNTSLYSLFV